MAETLTLALAWMAGLALGLTFFGGLCWTVQRGLESKHPALWFSGSLIVRTSIVLAGFYLIFDLHFERLVACLTGFVMAQLAVIILAPATAPPPSGPAQEASHAPLC